jgi:ribosome-associated protein
MAAIQLTPRTAISEAAIQLTFVRSAGPGGENVNKVWTAVELRLDLVRCRATVRGPRAP